MSELEININKLDLFVEALGKVPAQNINMGKSEEPNPICGTVGCHAGLIMQAAKFLPDLQGLYQRLDKEGFLEVQVGLGVPLGLNKYNFLLWSYALSHYLLGNGSVDKESFCTGLTLWAVKNPKDWGSTNCNMFTSEGAFGRRTWEVFPSIVIITRWREVLWRLKANKAYSELPWFEKMREKLRMVR